MNQTKAIIFGAIASLALLLGSCSVETVPAVQSISAKLKFLLAKISDSPASSSYFSSRFL